MIRAVAVAGAVLLGAAGALPAQTWRTLDAIGSAPDSTPVNVRIEYARGQLQARAADGAAPLLYDLHLRYDATRTRPLLRFDSAARSLEIGSQARPELKALAEGRAAGDAVVQLRRSGPLHVAVRLDAASANLDLGGLMMRSLAVHASISEARIRFDTANTTRMESLDLDASAATLRASGLANANAGRIRVATRAGSADLDLGGLWTSDIEMEIDITLASVTLHVPSDVAIELEMTRRILASVDAGDLRRVGDRYTSANAATATRKLRIRAGATVGKLELIHGSR